MRLFDFKRAPNPRRVRIFLAEKAVEIPTVAVNLYRMEQLSPEFLVINPAGTVPVLETDDGSYLTESIAIFRHLETLYPEPPLLGSRGLDEALVLMWNNICEHEGLRAAAETLRNLSPGFRDHALPGPTSVAQIPALVKRGAARMEQFFDRIEARLTNARHLAGSDFSCADISLLVTVDFAKWVDYDACQNRPSLATWYARVAARPSARA